MQNNKTIEDQGRLYGLDTLRSIAIILVFIYHYMVNVSGHATFGAGSEIGWVGVDLFFVLSGYLIANQLFTIIAKGHRFSLATFYGRRMMRTLPNYWVVLALYFLFPATMGGREPPPLWTFLTFTQNFGLHTGTAFSHAWSLCIEEQFYLVLPAVALLGASLRSIRTGWFVLIGAMVAGMVVRASLWSRYGADAESFYNNIYYSTWCRIDEFLPGVALAMLRNFHPELWSRLTKPANRILVGAVVAVALIFSVLLRFHEVDDGYNLWTTVFGYPLLACGFAALVLAALSPGSLLYKLRIPGAGNLALWSYAIYLSHKAVMNIAKQVLVQANIGVESVEGIALIVFASLIVGWLLYQLVERPTMKLRERWLGRTRIMPVAATQTT